MSPAPVVLDAGARLRRLLAILAYLARVGEAPIAELASRFELDAPTLVAELELAACCGLPPYTPDQLLELVVDDDRVVAFGLEALQRPPRLTRDEGFALATAVRALLAVPGADVEPLEHALAKLERALGEDRLSVELEAPEHTLALQRLAARGEQVEIDYLGARRGEETRREVEPFAVVTREGRFYLDAFCHLANDWRRFRIDRVRSLRPLARPVAARTVPAAFSGDRAFAGGGGARSARIAVAPGRAGFLERLVVGPTEIDARGWTVLTLEVADEEFFGRLMLGLGEEAEVLEPAELAGAAARVAQRAVRNYAQR